ncbi:hypothetical protein [Rhizobium sp. BK176]|uniref:hypothetical protein n=1 Tax=Rhizobium sp. BK176 TaxID=2587071 RepID=UPI002168A795|nr:hypothetical protein [Rhizobium sp. BK176]MCS4089113.1 hypothetical protein [Rhizobium sp. BK176]
MKLRIEYPRPSIGVPPGKRNPHLVYRRDQIEIEVPDLPHDAEHLVDYESRGDKFSVFRAGGLYYTNRMRGRLQIDDHERLASAIEAQIGIAVCGFAEASMRGYQVLPPAQGPEWSKVAQHLANLPSRSEFALRDEGGLYADRSIDAAIDVILAGFGNAYVSVGGEVYERCEEPRIELMHTGSTRWCLHVSTEPYPDFGHPPGIPFYLENKCAIAYFGIDREEEARNFAAANYVRNDSPIDATFGGLVYYGSVPMRGLEGDSLAAAVVRIESNARKELLGQPGAPNFGDYVLDELPVQTLVAYRELRGVAQSIAAGKSVEPDDIANALEAVIRSPEGGGLNPGGLPLEAMVGRWHDRPVSVPVTEPPHLKR